MTRSILTTYASTDISDTGLTVPRGIPLRQPISLANSTGLPVPSSAWAIPAAVIQPPNGAGSMQMAPPGRGNGHAAPAAAPPPTQTRPNDPLAGMTPKRIFIDCIWISKEPATNKLLLLCISRYFKPNATSSSLSYPQIAADCGFSERTGIRAAQDVRDRWLRIGIQQGHKTASGQKNLYIGIPPAELVEELRQRKMKGDVIEPDEAIVAAAEGMTPRHPLPEEGMTPCHPSDQRGDTVSERGDTDDTLILNKQEKKKDSLGADAPGVGAKTKRKVGKSEPTRLPDDWRLPEEWRTYPRERGLSERQIDNIERGFRRYWTGPDARNAAKRDWKRTWENRIDDQIERGLRPEGRSVSPSATGQTLPPYWWRDNPKAPAAIGTAGWRPLIAKHSNPWSVEMLGPPVGDPRCIIPTDVIRELGLTGRAGR